MYLNINFKVLVIAINYNKGISESYPLHQYFYRAFCKFCCCQLIYELDYRKKLAKTGLHLKPALKSPYRCSGY